MTLRIGLLASLVLLATAGLSVAQQEKGSIEGLVVRIGTEEPLEGAHVELVPSPGSPGPSTPLPVTTTGSDGKFFFKDLRAGVYRLRFTSNGYVRQEFGQRVFTGFGLPVHLPPGQELKNVVMAMSPTGSISGRVRDRNGDPLVGVPVQLMTYRYASTGQKVLQAFTTVPTDKTNDRGEYRIFYVTPGKYYVKAGTPTGDYRDELPEAKAQTYSNVFYPGVRDFREASTIDVRSDSDLRGIDFTLTAPAFYRVRGRIVDSRTGQAPAEVQVSLSYRDPSLNVYFNGEYKGGEKASYENGVFEFRNVVSGSFNVSALIYETPQGPPPYELRRRAGYTPVVVTSSDVEGVIVQVTPNASISGGWKMDGPTSAGRSVLQLTPSVGDSFLGNVAGFYVYYDVVLSSDGTLFVDNIVPGQYRLEPRSLQSGLYVKEAQFGGVDALSRPIRFTGTENGTLGIVVGRTAAVVDGRVTDERLAPIPYASVVLVPDSNRSRSDLFRTTAADQTGHFNIQNIVPGNYKIFSWDQIEPYAYFDPDLLRRSEPNGKALVVSESSRQTVDLKILAGVQ